MARAGKAKLDAEGAAIERFRLIAVKLTIDGEDLETIAVEGQTHRLTPSDAQSIMQRAEEHAARIAKNVRAMRRAADALVPFTARPAKSKSRPRTRG